MTQTQTLDVTKLNTCFFDTQAKTILDMVIPSTQKGAYSGETLEEISLRHATTVVVMDWEEAFKAYSEKFITPVEEIDAQAYDYFLNVLPPCQWQRGSFEHFYLSERITGDIVQYCVHHQKRFYKFQDHAGMTTAQIAARIDQAQAAAGNNTPAS